MKSICVLIRHEITVTELTEKRTMTLLEAATAADSLRSVGGGKLQTPEAWLIAASKAAGLPALGFTIKYLKQTRL